MGKILALISIVMLTGCANIKVHQPVQQHFEHTHIYPVQYNEVWGDILDWLAKKNVVIEKKSTSNGLIVATYHFDGKNAYLDSGKISTRGMKGRPQIHKTGTLNIMVDRIDNKQTRVSIILSGTYRVSAIDAWDGDLVFADGPCISTGNLEKELLHHIGH